MRHQHSRLRLNQKPAHAEQLQRNLVTSLFLYESIRTTRKRARVIQPIIDHVIATAKKGDAMNAIRTINKVVTDHNASRKVMEVFVKRYATRPSGFTRMVAAGARRGDGAQLVDLALIDAQLGTAAPATQEEKTTQKKAKAAKRSASKKTPASKV